MKHMLVIITAMIAVACAKVNVETKEPIKVDVNMRVDIYQHVVKDVQSINDQIYGGNEQQLNSLFFIQTAYAQEAASSPDAAIARRKGRFKEIEQYFIMGYIGENHNALLEIRSEIPTQEKARVMKAVQDENADREIIYAATAKKNGVDVNEIRKVFYDDDYKRALGGFLYEVSQNGRYVWVEK